jgi:uncharacterized membrane protein YfcA
MGLFDFLLFVVIGCGVGFLAGFFGIGGGLLIVPLLVFSYGYSGISPSIQTHLAIGTSLFIIIFTSLMSAFQHNKQHNIYWPAVFAIGLSSALTAIGTARLAVDLPGSHLRIVFALVVITTGVLMLTESKAESQKKLKLLSKPSILGLIGTGLASGVVSALAGVGGGVITVPMMYYFLKMPLKLTIGTSSATVIITAFFSVVGYILSGLGRTDLPEWSLGFVDLQRGIALIIGALLLARVGAYVSFRIHPYRLRILFALFIISLSIYMLVRS